MTQTKFDPTYTAVTKSGAEWIVAHPHIRLVGIDYLSIAHYADLIGPHIVLLSEVCPSSPIFTCVTAILKLQVSGHLQLHLLGKQNPAAWQNCSPFCSMVFSSGCVPVIAYLCKVKVPAPLLADVATCILVHEHFMHPLLLLYRGFTPSVEDPVLHHSVAALYLLPPLLACNTTAGSRKQTAGADLR